MATPIGIATFPGLRQIVRASITFSHGITPSIATLEIVPQQGVVAKQGTLAFRFAGVRIEFPEASVAETSLRFNEQGAIWSLQILDRRWKWAYGVISGRYNVHTESGTLDRATEKTPQALARLLLQAMGERRFDVGDLPNDTRPEVSWDYTNPARALAELCDDLACRVVLQNTNRVKIVKQGKGKQLPLPPVVTADYGSLQTTDKPDALLWVAGFTRIQQSLLLEAVGLDTDDQIKLLTELSYRPAPRAVLGGWASVTILPAPDGFSQVSDTPVVVNGQTRNPRELAQATVYRWYRIKEPSDLVETVNTIRRGVRAEWPDWDYKRTDQLLPLEPVLIQAGADGRNAPAFINGAFRDPLGAIGNTDLDTRYPGAFTIDAARGLVQFADYVYQWDAPGVADSNVEPAELHLVCTTPVRHQTLRSRHRLTGTLKLGRRGTGAHVIRDDDVGLGVRMIYEVDGGRVLAKGAEANIKGVRAEGERRTKAEAETFQDRAPRDVSYAGLVPIELDGAIQQVSYSVAQGEGAFTRASRDNEHSIYVPNHKQRRQAEKLKAQLEKKDKGKE